MLTAEPSLQSHEMLILKGTWNVLEIGKMPQAQIQVSVTEPQNLVLRTQVMEGKELTPTGFPWPLQNCDDDDGIYAG